MGSRIRNPIINPDMYLDSFVEHIFYGQENFSFFNQKQRFCSKEPQVLVHSFFFLSCSYFGNPLYFRLEFIKYKKTPIILTQISEINRCLYFVWENPNQSNLKHFIYWMCYLNNDRNYNLLFNNCHFVSQKLINSFFPDSQSINKLTRLFRYFLPVPQFKNEPKTTIELDEKNGFRFQYNDKIKRLIQKPIPNSFYFTNFIQIRRFPNNHMSMIYYPSNRN